MQIKKKFHFEFLLRILKELKMHGKDLYPAVEKFLKTKKNCLSEYVGSELSLKR